MIATQQPMVAGKVQSSFKRAGHLLTSHSVQGLRMTNELLKPLCSAAITVPPPHFTFGHLSFTSQPYQHHLVHKGHLAQRKSYFYGLIIKTVHKRLILLEHVAVLAKWNVTVVDIDNLFFVWAENNEALINRCIFHISVYLIKTDWTGERNQTVTTWNNWAILMSFVNILSAFNYKTRAQRTYACLIIMFA